MRPSQQIALSAVMCALLLVAQFVLSFVPGVEIVTALLLSFCVVFGWKCGMLAATSFSLLRCFLFGFYPNVILLYLIYFNLFALFFGTAGRRIAAWVCPALLVPVAAGALAVALAQIPLSASLLPGLRGAAWALFAVACALLLLWGGLLAGKREVRAATLAACAAFFTVFFTLLDDVLTPLFYGYTPDAALGYFYTGLLAMIPQTLCAAVSVVVLFPVFARIFGGGRKIPPQTLDE